MGGNHFILSSLTHLRFSFYNLKLRYATAHCIKRRMAFLVGRGELWWGWWVYIGCFVCIG